MYQILRKQFLVPVRTMAGTYPNQSKVINRAELLSVGNDEN